MRAESSGVASGFFSEPLKESGGVVDFGGGLGEGFALLEGDDAGEVVFSGEEKCGGSFEDVAAFEGRHGLPLGLDSGCVGCGGGEGDGIGESHGCEGLRGGWVDDFALACGEGPFAVEPELGFEPEVGEVSHGECVSGLVWRKVGWSDDS